MNMYTVWTHNGGSNRQYTYACETIIWFIGWLTLCKKITNPLWIICHDCKQLNGYFYLYEYFLTKEAIVKVFLTIPFFRGTVIRGGEIPLSLLPSPNTSFVNNILFKNLGGRGLISPLPIFTNAGFFKLMN